MHPAALVLPARHSMIWHSGSLTMVLRISAALAVSLAVKDISFIASIILLESNDFMSICLTGSFSKSFFSILTSEGDPILQSDRKMGTQFVAQQFINKFRR